MRVPLEKMWLVGGLALATAACAGRAGIPSGPAAVAPALEVAAPASAMVAETIAVTPTVPAVRDASTARGMPAMPTEVATIGAATMPAGTLATSDTLGAVATVVLTGTVAPVVAPEATGVAPRELTIEQEQLLASLPSRGRAPELRNDIWLNSEPLQLADLRGKVVLLDMWTFG